MKLLLLLGLLCAVSLYSAPPLTGSQLAQLAERIVFQQAGEAEALSALGEQEGRILWGRLANLTPVQREIARALDWKLIRNLAEQEKWNPESFLLNFLSHLDMISVSPFHSPKAGELFCSGPQSLEPSQPIPGKRVRTRKEAQELIRRFRASVELPELASVGIGTNASGHSLAIYLRHGASTVGIPQSFEGYRVVVSRGIPAAVAYSAEEKADLETLAGKQTAVADLAAHLLKAKSNNEQLKIMLSWDGFASKGDLLTSVRIALEEMKAMGLKVSGEDLDFPVLVISGNVGQWRRAIRALEKAQPSHLAINLRISGDC